MNILLSYPRSGNTWLRYCIEFLTKKPTIGYTSSNASEFDKKSLGYFNTEMGVDLKSDPILIKRHMVGYTNGDPAEWSENDNLILIVRNYKEVLIRHNNGNSNINTLKKGCSSHIISNNYIQLIEYYNNFNGNKKIFYYEDILKNLEITLKEMLDFLNVSDEYLEKFIENIDYHKQKSINIYGNSRTKGKSTKSHSNKLTKEEKLSWDGWLKSNHKGLSEKYLSRYYEKEN